MCPGVWPGVANTSSPPKIGNIWPSLKTWSIATGGVGMMYLPMNAKMALVIRLPLTSRDKPPRSMADFSIALLQTVAPVFSFSS